MIQLITFTDERMTKSATELLRSAYGIGGCDLILAYTKNELPATFIQMASPAILADRGAGLWIWKPFICFDAINNLNDGDILIYADAGQTLVNNVSHVIEAMDEDIMFFSNGWNHVDWCKMDVMKNINNYDQFDIDGDHSILRYKQVQASLIFFKVNQKTRDFIKEWMLYCLMPGFCDESPSKIPNYPTFQETRHDQAVLTCLQIKYGYKLHWFPSITAGHIHNDYPDKYPAITDHHRRRNEDWK